MLMIVRPVQCCLRITAALSVTVAMSDICYKSCTGNAYQIPRLLAMTGHMTPQDASAPSTME